MLNVFEIVRNCRLGFKRSMELSNIAKDVERCKGLHQELQMHLAYPVPKLQPAGAVCFGDFAGWGM